MSLREACACLSKSSMLIRWTGAPERDDSDVGSLVILKVCRLAVGRSAQSLGRSEGRWGRACLCHGHPGQAKLVMTEQRRCSVLGWEDYAHTQPKAPATALDVRRRLDV